MKTLVVKIDPHDASIYDPHDNPALN